MCRVIIVSIGRKERVYKHEVKLAKFEKYWVWGLPTNKHFNVAVLNTFTMRNVFL